MRSDLAPTREHLEPEKYNEAWQRGRTLTLREAVIVALDAVSAQRP